MNATVETPSDHFNESIKNLEIRWFRSLLLVYISLVTVAGVVMNGLVIVAFFKNKSLRTPVNIYILNLCISNLLSAVASASFILPINLSRRNAFGDIGCLFYVLICGVLGVTGLCTIVALAITHYIIICKSKNFTLRLKHSIFGTVAVWVWSIIWNILLVASGGYGLDELHSVCGIVWNDVDEKIIEYCLYMIFCFLLPLAILFFCYGAILCEVRKQTKHSSLQSISPKDALLRTAKMVFVIMIVFLICWCPYGCITLLTMVNPTYKMSSIYETIASFFAKSSYVTSPIVYVLMNNQVRKCVLQVLRRRPAAQQDSKNETRLSVMNKEHKSLKSSSDT